MLAVVFGSFYFIAIGSKPGCLFQFSNFQTNDQIKKNKQTYACLCARVYVSSDYFAHKTIECKIYTSADKIFSSSMPLFLLFHGLPVKKKTTTTFLILHCSNLFRLPYSLNVRETHACSHTKHKYVFAFVLIFTIRIFTGRKNEKKWSLQYNIVFQWQWYCNALKTHKIYGINHKCLSE